MRFSWQEYCSGLQFPTPEDLPSPGFKLASPSSLSLAASFFIISPLGKTQQFPLNKSKCQGTEVAASRKLIPLLYPEFYSLWGPHCSQEFYPISHNTKMIPSSSFFFNWGIVGRQCYVSFCYKTKWVSYMYTYNPLSLEFLLCPLPWPIPSFWVITEHRAEPPYCKAFH